MNYIKSPMNYIGGKYNILNHIIPNLPGQIDSFVDLFAGGFNVGINVNANTIYANDQISYLIDLYRMFSETKTEILLAEINNRISTFNLTKTNVVGYNTFREEYNKTKSLLDLFVLTCYSFNHQIRFNNKHEFNTPFGKNRSSYNDSIESNLIRFCDVLHKKNINFSSVDFREFDYSVLNKGDVVYCDPPYLITTGSYNDGKRGFRDWTTEEDSALLDILDNLNSNGILFALSNVFYHKGRENAPLIDWSTNYNVTFIDKSYSNCNYHLKERDTKTVEVLITNYELEEQQ